MNLTALVLQLITDTSNFTAPLTGAMKTVTLFGQVTAVSLSVATAALAGLGEAASSVMTPIITLGLQYQQTATAFEVMTGSAAAGAKLLQEVRDVAVETPFSLRGTREAARELLGLGVAAKEVPNVLLRLGDIAAGNEDKLMRLSLVFGRVQEAGRMTAMDLRMFATAGVGAKDFADAAGTSVREFRDKLHQGVIGADVMEKTINSLTGATGRFGGMSARQLETAIGRWSNLKDTVESFAERLGANLLTRLDVSGVIRSLTEAMGNLDDVMEPVIRVFQDLRDIAFDVFGVLKAGWAAVVGEISSPKQAVESVHDLLLSLRGSLLDFFPKLVGWIKNITDLIMNLSLTVGRLFLSFMQSSFVDGLRKLLPGTFFGDDSRFKSGLVNLEMTLHRMESGIGVVDAFFDRWVAGAENVQRLTPTLASSVSDYLKLFHGQKVVAGSAGNAIAEAADKAAFGLGFSNPKVRSGEVSFDYGLARTNLFLAGSLGAAAAADLGGPATALSKRLSDPLQAVQDAITGIPGLADRAAAALTDTLGGAFRAVAVHAQAMSADAEKLFVGLKDKIEKGVTPIDQFRRQMGLLAEVERSMNEDVRAGRVADANTKFAVVREGRFEAFEKLRKDTGGGEARLAPAAIKGSQEAADAINKTISENQSRQDDLIQAVTAGNVIAGEHKKATEEVFRILGSVSDNGQLRVTVGEGQDVK